MMPHIPKMKTLLSEVLNLSQDNLSIKAKTKEELDAVGNQQAIEANAVVLLRKKDA